MQSEKRKLITINAEPEQALDFRTKTKFYQIAKSINVDVNSDRLPEIYEDIEANLEFTCKSKVSTPIAKITNILENAKEQYLEAFLQFEAEVLQIEKTAIEGLKSIAESIKDNPDCDYPDFVMQPVSIKFTNQDGDATICMRVSTLNGSCPVPKPKEGIVEVVEVVEPNLQVPIQITQGY